MMMVCCHPIFDWSSLSKWARLLVSTERASQVVESQWRILRKSSISLSHLSAWDIRRCMRAGMEACTVEVFSHMHLTWSSSSWSTTTGSRSSIHNRSAKTTWKHCTTRSLLIESRLNKTRDCHSSLRLVTWASAGRHCINLQKRTSKCQSRSTHSNCQTWSLSWSTGLFQRLQSSLLISTVSNRLLITSRRQRGIRKSQLWPSPHWSWSQSSSASSLHLRGSLEQSPFKPYWTPRFWASSTSAASRNSSRLMLRTQVRWATTKSNSRSKSPSS